MITWSELKRAAQQAGWKRNGRTWRGAPCPSCGGGTRDTAWVGPGTRAEFVAGCNAGCNGIQIARALVPDSDPSPVSTGLCESGEFSTSIYPTHISSIHPTFPLDPSSIHPTPWCGLVNAI